MTVETAIKARKLTHYSLPWEEFAPDPANLRTDIDAHIEEQGLLQLIKADGGVRVPVFATGKNEKYTIDGKRVILDGSSRRRCLEILSEDPEYLEAVERGEASLELPFIIVPDDVVEDPKKLAKFKLSSNWVNSQTTTVEQWSGIKDIIDHFRTEYDCEPPTIADPDNLTDQDTQNQKTFLREQNHWVVKKTSEFIGLSVQQIYEYLRVFENGHPRVLELIKEGVIVSIRAAGDINRYHKKLIEEGSSISIDDFVKECYDRAMADGKPTLGRNTIEYTYKGLSLPVAEKLEQVNAIAASSETGLQTVQNGAKQLELTPQSEADLTRLQAEVNGLGVDDLEDVENGVTSLPTQKPAQTNSGSASSGSGATRSEQREPKQQLDEPEEIYDRQMAIGDINDLISMAMAVDDDQLFALPEKNILRIGKAAKQLIKEFETLQEILAKERQKQMQQEEAEKLKDTDEDDSEDDVEFDDDLDDDLDGSELSEDELEARKQLGLGTDENEVYGEEDSEDDDTEFDDDVD